MQEGYNITTDPAKINLDLVHQFLSHESYWAKNIPHPVLKRALEHSFCFMVLYKEEQVGFARVITDKATFAYLADVFILPEHQGKGLGRWLLESILNHSELQGLRSWMLATKDAHGLYEKFGFELTNNTTRIMRKPGLEGYVEQ
jgi:ribosomal protein S18 acetylase RimI-like enzyme